MMRRTYAELRQLKTFEERFDYLKLSGKVGAQTFGWDRPLNQAFYRSPHWRSVRDQVIYRDQGLDLGCVGYEILTKVIIHHMNPITNVDLEDFNPEILDPNYLITTSVVTHRAIHYGDENQIPRLSHDRRPGDTKLW